MRRFGRLTRALSALALVTLLGGCERGRATDSSGRPRVVASFYPLFEVAQRVGGGLVQVTNLTPAGSEPHDLELTTRQVDRIEDAAVVLLLGRGFQPALERAAARARGTKVDVLTDLGALLPAPAGDDALDVDPHVWLDPRSFSGIVRRVAAVFAEVDPPHAETYRSNAATYLGELGVLDDAYAKGLAQCDRRVLITSHAAFGYLAARYGLTQEAIAGLEPESEPSPKRLSDLTARVRATGTTTIFYETLVSPKVARALAREAGVRTAVLDPLEGLSDSDARAGRNYVSAMGENLAALRSALRCR